MSLRRFVGMDLEARPVPDESTVRRFRHMLKVHALGEKLFQQVQAYLEYQGIKIGTGTIVDATIISAPPSTKNKDKRRDPDMHQKGNHWYFGLKAHLGVDSQSTIIHALAAAPANVPDSTCLPDLLHGEKTRVWEGSAYQGQSEILRAHASKAKDCTLRRYRYKDRVDEVERATNKIRSRVRAKVEHPCLIKRLFGFVKTRDVRRGLEKNAPRLFVTCALANVDLLRRRLWRLSGA